MSSFCSKSFQRKVTWVASVALVAQPQLLTAAQPAAITPTANTRQVIEAPHDVALADGGTVTGQVVDTAGKPQANMPVTLNSSNKEIARVHTDAEGNFRVASLQGGVYHVATNGNEGVYRFWAPRTAPPGSQTGLNLVSGQNVYRGQVGGGPFTSIGQWIAEHPIMTAAGVATAIAVPLALQDDDDDPPASP
ncbi:carboxypeptidase-like regulatory domain-containing protein [Bythopirellula polymerisocia]|uniref:Nickel uptake substrate-specific transmembrane region n=1 Tax=Bythopirellula polymerisocia TaxID=2528003 RepID=A0A5C6CFJ8_9BACT|nr:carboxypeptidase-like regulatory domain-containing protein [Bythopirellula polymerisocia]TWU23683.1 Nickel uptake substrate-specific transmembrane region [Bythopirellula polymerisocia]